MSARTRVAFQGTHGAFSEEAILSALGGSAGVETTGRASFSEVVDAVVSGEVELALLPVENTLAGSVHASLEALAAAELELLAEVVMPIRHHVMGVAGASLAGLRSVRSHPVALAQCTRFFEEHPGVEAVVTYDTAGAADEVADGADRTVAAIAPLGNAARRGLEVLAPDVQDRADNQTRFLLVGRPRSTRPELSGLAVGQRAIVSAEIPNRPGALARLLTMVAEAGHDLTRIEGRPTGTPWRYRFVLEMTLAGPFDAPGRGLTLEGPGWALRVLGTFRRYDLSGAPVDPAEGGAGTLGGGPGSAAAGAV